MSSKDLVMNLYNNTNWKQMTTEPISLYSSYIFFNILCLFFSLKIHNTELKLEWA